MPSCNILRRAAAGLALCLFSALAAANTYTVSNTNDSGAGSLRQAILDANAHMGSDTIWFIIPAATKVITPTTALPDITDPVLLDGWVQTGFSHDPLIRIDGSLVGGTYSGLRIYASSTTVRGLIFTRWGTGVTVGSGTTLSFRGCWFGTDGSASALGNGTGMRLIAGSSITLGGVNAADPNVFSGNTTYGIYVDPTVSGLTMLGNLVGTNPAGTAALGNGSVGVRSFASNVTVGGATTAARNLFSGNGGSGLVIEAGSDVVSIKGNFFGLDTTGAVDLGNGGSGLSELGTNATIGGSAAGEGNVASGNAYSGIEVGGATAQVLGNRIGTNPAGTAAIPNDGDGLDVSGDAVTVGGSAAGARNVVSGNGGEGLLVEGTASAVVVKGNLFGLDVSGTSALGNGGSGINDYGDGTVIGGTSAGEGNVSSGNAYSGAGLQGINTVVLGNRFGTNAAGTAKIGNGPSGLYVSGVNIAIGNSTAAGRNLISGNDGGAMAIDGAADGVFVYGNYLGTDASGALALGNGGGGIGTYGSNVSIGGTVAGSGNVISGNGSDGLYIGAGSNLAIRRNYIGTDATGQFPLGNLGYAIRADGAPGTQIGTPGNGNVISANNRGIAIGYDASGYLIRGNIIGLNKDATQPLGNKEYGIILGTADNVIGGPALGAFNIIGASTYYGIFIYGAGATNNHVENNYIGTNTTFATGLGNWFGVVIYGGNGNTIGGTAAGTGNWISDSVNSGINDWFGSRNRFLQNNIFRNGGPGIENDPHGPQPNDKLDTDHGPNEGQNFPTVTTATAGANSVTVAGFLDSLPSTQFRVEYFVSSACEASGFGEGEHYVGFQNVTSGSDGKAVLGTVLSTSYVSGFVTATATDPAGNTSEFSPCLAIGAPTAGEFNVFRSPSLAYEDEGLAEILVTRTLGLSGSVSVRVKTTDGTATAPADYTAYDQVLAFADGESVKKIVIPVVLDADQAEGDEQFHLDLSQPTGGAALGPQASVDVIVFNHDPDYPFWTVGDVGVEPPPSGQKIINVPINLSSPAVNPITITFNTEDGTAIAGQDYVAIPAGSGQVVFSPGDKAKLVPVTITANGPLAADRVFYLRLNGAIGQVIADDSEGEVTIFGGDVIFRSGFN